MTTATHLYRFIDSDVLHTVLPILVKYPVVKETPCGYWIKIYHFADDKKFVYKCATRGFAKETIKDAFGSYYARKNRQHKILESQLEYVGYILSEMTTKERRDELVDFYEKNDVQPNSAEMTYSHFYPDWQ
jgi:hypothetical protein